MTVALKEAPANPVPAAAVRREGLALPGFTGCKGSVCSQVSLILNPLAQPENWVRNCLALSSEEESGTAGVAVKCVDIGRNTSGEGGFLLRY